MDTMFGCSELIFNTIGNINELDVSSETQVIADGTETVIWIDNFSLLIGLFGLDIYVGGRQYGSTNNL